MLARHEPRLRLPVGEIRACATACYLPARWSAQMRGVASGRQQRAEAGFFAHGLACLRIYPGGFLFGVSGIESPGRRRRALRLSGLARRSPMTPIGFLRRHLQCWARRQVLAYRSGIASPRRGQERLSRSCLADRTAIGFRLPGLFPRDDFLVRLACLFPAWALRS